MQGELGYDIGPFSLRDVLQMVEGKRHSQWDHTAALILHMRRCQGDKTIKFQTLHPYLAKDDQRKEFKKLFRG